MPEDSFCFIPYRNKIPLRQRLIVGRHIVHKELRMSCPISDRSDVCVHEIIFILMNSIN